MSNSAVALVGIELVENGRIEPFGQGFGPRKMRGNEDHAVRWSTSAGVITISSPAGVWVIVRFSACAW